MRILPKRAAPFALALAAAALSGSARAAEGAGLPKVECVQRMREGRILADAGDVAKAAAKLEEAVALCPGSPVPALALVQFHQSRKSTAEEITRLVARLEEKLADPNALVASSVFLKLVEDPGASNVDLSLVRKGIEARLARSPDEPRLLESLAVVQTRLDDLVEARRTRARILEVTGSEAALRRLVELDLRLRRWGDAVPHLRSLVKARPEDAAVRWQLARALAESGQPEQAIEELKAVPAKSPFVFPPLVLGVLFPSAWAFRDQGKDAEAEKVFRMVLEKDATNAVARDAILYLYASGAEREARAALTAERWKTERDPVRLLNEGGSRLAAGDAAAAIDLLLRSTELDPGNDAAWFNLGLAALKLERWEEAAGALRKALLIRPDLPKARLDLGIALARLSRFQEAIDELLPVVAAEPRNALAHDYLRFCYERIGKAAEAEKHRRLAAGEPG